MAWLIQEMIQFGLLEHMVVGKAGLIYYGQIVESLENDFGF